MNRTFYTLKLGDVVKEVLRNMKPGVLIRKQEKLKTNEKGQNNNTEKTK